MKKLEVIAVLIVLAATWLVDITTPIALFSAVSDAAHVDHENRLPRQLQPVEVMVDATNHLGFKMLNSHSALNKNNIAFSPVGLMSVLVALYEGSAGRSKIELVEALHFPRERDIVRVGVRDIHRRLRSYFYKSENLLSGLIFNKENITIRPEYETVLRFYGYDLDGSTNMLTESRMNETSPEASTELPSGNDSTSTTTTTTTTTTVATNEGEAETTTLPETSTEPNAEETDVGESTVPNEGDEEETTTTTVAPERRKRRGRLVGDGRLAKRGHNHYQIRRDKLQHHQNLELKKIHPNRRSRSYYVLLDEDEYEPDFHHHSPHYHYAEHEASTFHPPLVVTTPSPHPDVSVTPVGVPSSTSTNPQHHQLSDQPISISSARPVIGKHRHANKELFENPKSDTIEHIFHLSEIESVRVPFKIYDSVMKFAHIPSLQASVLEIELDTEYYNLIIIMPDHYEGLKDLTNRLRLHEPSTLRKLRATMEFCWVKTIVPKFSLKGNTILTNDLQNMGIMDIFEPTKADFSQLANDKTLYVKNVEQTININIRTAQSVEALKKISSLYKHPIEVPVNIPFIYCVVDRELDLAIIAGRIINPLNSRIQ